MISNVSTFLIFRRYFLHRHSMRLMQYELEKGSTFFRHRLRKIGGDDVVFSLVPDLTPVAAATSITCGNPQRSRRRYAVVVVVMVLLVTPCVVMSY